MFSLESPYRGDSNGYTKYTVFNIKKKIIPNLQLWDCFQGTQERVRISRGKQAISVHLRYDNYQLLLSAETHGILRVNKIYTLQCFL